MKRTATKKAGGETKFSTLKEILDELQGETERLLALLKDRQPYLMTWYESLLKRLERLHELTSRVPGK